MTQEAAKLNLYLVLPIILLPLQPPVGGKVATCYLMLTVKVLEVVTLVILKKHLIYTLHVLFKLIYKYFIFYEFDYFKNSFKV